MSETIAKNTRASVAAVTGALIMGLMVALWLALMSAPAQAQTGDVLRLLSIKAVDITDDDGGIYGDKVDEPSIKVDGTQVWSGTMKNGDFVDLGGVAVRLSGDNAQVQLVERDAGNLFNSHDVLGEFFAGYIDGAEKTRTINYNNYEAVYEIRYVVDRPPDSHPDVVVPHVQGMRQSQAARAIYDVGLVPSFTGPRGSWSWVYGQSPGGGTTVPYGSTVTLRLTDRPML